MKHIITLTVNGDTYHMGIDPWRTLNHILREGLNLTGTKLGCNSGDCGACTVLLDGRSVSFHQGHTLPGEPTRRKSTNLSTFILVYLALRAGKS